MIERCELSRKETKQLFGVMTVWSFRRNRYGPSDALARVVRHTARTLRFELVEYQPSYIGDKTFEIPLIVESSVVRINRQDNPDEVAEIRIEDRLSGRVLVACSPSHPKTVVKCSFKVTPPTYCPAMSHNLGMQHTKGLQVLELTNMTTGTHRIAGVMYRTSAADKGMMLNFCPWCGSELDPKGCALEEPTPQLEPAKT